MPISGTLVASGSYPQDNSPSVHDDTITLSSGVTAGNWLMLVQLGGYAFANGPGIPPTPVPSVSATPFDSLQDTALAFDIPPHGTPEFNEAVQQQAYDPGSGMNIAYVDDTYPVVAYSAPGLLSSSLSSSHSLNIHWGSLSAAENYIEAYAAFLTEIVAPFDLDAFQEGIWLEGSSSDTGGSTNNIASGTTSPAQTTGASTLAAAGHGSIAVTAIGWNDTTQTPTLTSGWTLLSTYADATTGWAGLLAGRTFPAGDTGPYTVDATFSSAVKSASVIDTWQATAAAGLHIWQRF